MQIKWYPNPVNSDDQRGSGTQTPDHLPCSPALGLVQVSQQEQLRELEILSVGSDTQRQAPVTVLAAPELALAGYFTSLSLSFSTWQGPPVHPSQVSVL